MFSFILDSIWADILYPRPTSINAAIGGWWLICSAYAGQPLIEHWNVSPMIGLNGFYISKYMGEVVIPKTNVYKNRSRSFIFVAGYKRQGANPMLKRNFYKLLYDEKISTGRLIFSIDLPETRFLATCEKINFKTPFWSSICFLLINLNPPSSRNYQFPFHIGCSLFGFFRYTNSFLSAGSGPVPCFL